MKLKLNTNFINMLATLLKRSKRSKHLYFSSFLQNHINDLKKYLERYKKNNIFERFFI